MKRDKQVNVKCKRPLLIPIKVNTSANFKGKAALPFWPIITRHCWKMKYVAGLDCSERHGGDEFFI